MFAIVKIVDQLILMSCWSENFDTFVSSYRNDRLNCIKGYICNEAEPTIKILMSPIVKRSFCVKVNLTVLNTFLQILASCKALNKLQRKINKTSDYACIIQVRYTAKK